MRCFMRAASSFGTQGTIEGVAGSEAANNAAVTMAMIPLLTLLYIGNVMSIGEGSALVFLQRPVSLILIGVVVAVLVLPRLVKRWVNRARPA